MPAWMIGPLLNFVLDTSAELYYATDYGKRPSPTTKR